MTVESPSKPKRGLPDQRAAWPGYVALLIALGVCILLLIGSHAVANFPDARGTPIFYPLIPLMTSSFYAPYWWGSVSLILMVLVVFAFLKHARALSVFMFILVWGVVGYSALILSADQTKVNLNQSILYADRIYQLFDTRDTTASEQTIYTYTIVKCDSLNLICHYFSTPHRINTRLDGVSASAFDKSGLLFIEENTNTLKLRVGAEIYIIDPWADLPW